MSRAATERESESGPRLSGRMRLALFATAVAALGALLAVAVEKDLV